MYDELTEKDIQKMEEEIEHRKLVVRKQALEDVKEARAHGDLSENFEYKAAKKFKNENESRIRYLEKMIRTAKIISEDSAEDEVGMNNTVELYFEEDDETSIATVCVLFEKTPSSAPVYFLDASEFCVKGKKTNELSDEHIGQICAMIAERRIVEYQSAIKEQAVVASNDFNLSPNAYVEVKHESDNPYDGMSIVEVVEDGEAWARFSYYKQMKALALMRQTFGLPYDPEILDKDVDAFKPKSYGTFNRSHNEERKN